MILAVFLFYNVMERRVSAERLAASRALSDLDARLLATTQEALAEQRKASSEREVLLREIYHRVKNNLQIVQSLLRLGSRDLGPDQRDAFESAIRRIGAMARVHTLLYSSADLASIDLREYLDGLSKEVADAFGAQERGIRTVVEADAMRVPLDTAVPLAFIAVEVLTNAFKHAFPAGRGGTIKVERAAERRPRHPRHQRRRRRHEARERRAAGARPHHRLEAHPADRRRAREAGGGTLDGQDRLPARRRLGGPRGGGRGAAPPRRRRLLIGPKRASIFRVAAGCRRAGCRIRGPKRCGAPARASTMSRQSPFGHPFLLGFDEIEQALDRVSKAASDGYPPYNIERVARTEREPERLRITLAVAGFTRDQLEITLEESQLVIRGRQSDDKARQYLHRGIAARQFQRAFLLAEGMEVLGADLSDGLLSIDLARPEPERIVRKIDIASRDEI